MTVALTVPTRVLGAALVAAGVVAEDYKCELARDNLGRFLDLLDLPRGATVRLTERKDGRTRQVLAAVDGLRDVGGETRLRLQLSKSVWRQVPESKAWAVEPIQVGNWAPGSHIRHWAWVDDSPFLTAAFAPVDADQFAQPSGLDCTYVGNVAEFHREIQACELAAIDEDGSLQTGRLVDLLRPVLPPYTQTARLGLLSASAKPRAARATLSGIAVLDGARAYLRLGAQASGTRVVILDRTEGSFSDALARLQEDYRRRGDRHNFELGLPNGVDMVAFTAGVKL